MKKALAIFSTFILCSCTSGDGKEGNSEILRNQIGRFQAVGASEGYPPLVVDTIAGCVMEVQKGEDGSIKIDEVNFPDGTNSCKASKQVLVVETLSRIEAK